MAWLGLNQAKFSVFVRRRAKFSVFVLTLAFLDDSIMKYEGLVLSFTPGAILTDFA